MVTTIFWRSPQKLDPFIDIFDFLVKCRGILGAIVLQKSPDRTGAFGVVFTGTNGQGERIEHSTFLTIGMHWLWQDG